MRKKILIIEDELPLLKALRDRLKNDFDVYVAENGVVGLENMKKYKPDLVLLDILMPVMTGEQVIEKMTEEQIDTPVIVLSNCQQDEIGKLPVKKVLNKSETKLKELVEEVTNTLK